MIEILGNTFQGKFTLLSYKLVFIENDFLNQNLHLTEPHKYLLLFLYIILCANYVIFAVNYMPKVILL